MDNELNIVLKIVVFVLVLAVIFMIFNSNTETFEEIPELPVIEMESDGMDIPNIEMPPANDVLSEIPMVNESQELTANDLLPKYDEASEFVQNNPSYKIVNRDKLREMLFGYNEENVFEYYLSK